MRYFFPYFAPLVLTVQASIVMMIEASYGSGTKLFLTSAIVLFISVCVLGAFAIRRDARDTSTMGLKIMRIEYSIPNHIPNKQIFKYIKKYKQKERRSKCSTN